jgi:hypothetical protein
VDTSGVDGTNSRFSVGICSEEHSASIWIALPCPLEELNPCHSRHSLIAQEQRNRFLPGLQLRKSIKRSLPTGSAQYSVFSSILAPQVLHDCFQDTYIVIDCQ